MKVILLKNIQGIGRADEIKEVKTGYARNFLIPKGLVILATQKEIEKLEAKKEINEKEKAREIEKAKKIKKKLEKIKLNIKVKADEKGKLFGSVGPKQIAEALSEREVEVDEKQIEMQGIKEVGEYLVKVRLAEGVEGKMGIKISNF